MAFGTDTYTVKVRPESGKYLATVTMEKAGGDMRESYTTQEPVAVALADTADEALRTVVLEAFDL